jgi:hypothetical protein
VYKIILITIVTTVISTFITIIFIRWDDTLLKLWQQLSTASIVLQTILCSNLVKKEF